MSTTLRPRLPSAAEPLVQEHEVGFARELRADQALLRRVELALRVEQTQRRRRKRLRDRFLAYASARVGVRRR